MNRHKRSAQLFRKQLGKADIKVGGSRPWDIDVRDDRLFQRVRRHGLPGLGDAYVDGWWECEAIDVFFDRALRADLPGIFRFHPFTIGRHLREKLLNLQSRPRAARNSESHYDRGNNLFRAMLDQRMMYSCGYWEHACNLDEAQEQKLELICRKLDLKPGHRVLDIGCGWGGFAKYAAERYGCEVLGINLSIDQVREARARCHGLPVEIRRQDYREIDERFNRIVSIGMFEHVGGKNHRRFMNVVSRCLKSDGLCLLHFFATQRTWPNCLDTELFWIQRHIFPGLVVPSFKQVGVAIDDRFVVEDLHNFGAHYDPTLMAWFENFDRAWPSLRETYGERFYRLWKYYLLSCAGAFRSRKYQLWQFVLSPTGVRGGWRRPAGARVSEVATPEGCESTDRAEPSVISRITATDAASRS